MSKRVTSNSPVSEGTIINSLIDGGVQVQDELSDNFLQNLSDSDAENDSDISVRAIDDNQSDVDDTDDDPDFILPSDNEELLDSEGDVAQISLPSTSTGRPTSFGKILIVQLCFKVAPSNLLIREYRGVLHVTCLPELSLANVTSCCVLFRAPSLPRNIVSALVACLSTVASNHFGFEMR
ncbi:hypothetical protein J6590_075818 [Homalodisca vitripennis]|nr:hypothetical protein J6590_075818 [Homalodisca vitripennis]